MQLTRRSMLGACAGTVSGLGVAPSAASGAHGSLGLVIHSFAVRTAGDRGRRSEDRFSDPARFLDHARSLGAQGVQVGLGALDDTAAAALRERARAASLYLEGIVSLPRDEADSGRFEAEIRTAKRAGAEVVRTVLLSGRRYETFATAALFRRFADASSHSLRLAAPLVARHDIRLAVENHKDWRADELLAVLKRVGNDHVGVCLDTGNSIALLEDPMDVVEALAPRAFTTHFKDMGLEEYRQGFLLAEVPLGTGILDLPRAVRILRAARAEIRFNVEMITRDPLKVPCLTESYWKTFPDLPGRHLAHILSLVRDHPPSRPLPRISPLPQGEQLRAEDENVRRCLAFAREQLGM
ncbi:MAG: sugar phosphate isomerase/epimerase family protein [Isosphaerales bacterium]